MADDSFSTTDDPGRSDGDGGADDPATTAEGVDDAVDPAGDDGDLPTTERAAGEETGASGSSLRSREVVVPLRLYKTVTVFTTLFSAVLVVAGFVLLDAATNRARADLADVDPGLTVLGLAAIAAGGLLYAFASRFRAVGMGKDKDDAAEDSDDG